MVDDSEVREGAAEGEDGPVRIVALAASTDRVDALYGVFDRLPRDTRMAFVVVTDGGGDRARGLAEQLAGRTSMPVLEVRGSAAIAPDHVYVAGSGDVLDVADGRLTTRLPTSDVDAPSAIDRFFTSLANDYGRRAIAVVLASIGSDGMLGATAIMGAAGIVIAQDDRPADYPMVPVSDIAALLAELARRELRHVAAPGDPRSDLDSAPNTHGVPPQKLVSALLRAQDDERRRIARELHDGPGQSLASVELGLARCVQLTDDPRVREHAEQLAAIVRRAAEEVRRCSRRLHPAVLDDLGLAPAIERLAAEEAATHDIEAVVHATGLDGLGPEKSLALYRVVQEALSNALMHGNAKHIRITATREPAGVALTITDDGRGFVVEARRQGGLGLRGMRERIEELGGSFEVESRLRAGTTVRAVLPTETLA